MPGTNSQNIIELGFDTAQLAEEQKQILKMFDEIFNAAKKMDGIKFGFGDSKGYAEVNEKIKEQQTIIDQLTISIDKLTKKQEDNKKKTDEQKMTEQVLAADRKKRMKEEITNSLDLGNAYEKLERAYKNAAKEAKNLSITNPGSTAAYQANATALNLKKQLDAAKDSVGDFTGHVGDYKNKIKEALEETGLLGTEGGQKISMLSNAFGMLKNGIGKVVEAFSTIKGAIMATGIGALVIAISALFAWMKETTNGAKFMRETWGGLKYDIEALSEAFANLFNKKSEAKEFGDQMEEYYGKGSKAMYEQMNLAEKLGARLTYWFEKGRERADEEYDNAQLLRDSKIDEAKLNVQVNQLRQESIDRTNDNTKRVELLSEAIEKQREKYKLLAKDAVIQYSEEFARIQDKINMGEKVSEEEKTRLNELKVAKINITAEGIASERRMAKELENLKEQIRKEEIDLNISMLKDEQEKRTDTNRRILEDQKSTLQQKINAERGNLEENIKLNRAERDAKLSDITLSETKRKTIIQEAATEEFKIRSDEKERERKLLEDYRKRDVVASTEIEKTKLESEKDFFLSELKQDQELYDHKLNFQDRVSISQRMTDIEMKEEKANFNKLIANDAGKTALEIEAITNEHNRKMKLIETKGQLDLIAIQKEFYKKALDEESRIGSEKENDLLGNYNKKLEGLYDGLQKGGISLKDFNEQKENLDKSFTKDSISQQLVVLRRQRQEAIGQSDYDTADKFQKQILNLEKSYIDQDIDLEKVAAEKKKRLIHEIAETTMSVSKATGELLLNIANQRIEKEKQQNETRLSQIESQKAAEEERINSSTLSEQEKANEISRLNANAQLQKEQIDNQQRKLDRDKAKNDRAFQVFEIIGSTAMGVMNAVSESPMTGGLPGSAIALAMGALQLGKVLSTPLPKYADGREGGKAEWALTDEVGPELFIEKSGKISIGSNRPTLRFLNQGTKVIPHNKIDQFIMESSIRLPDTDSRNDSEYLANKITGMIAWQTEEFKKIIKGNKSKNINHIHIDLGFQDYVNKQIKL